MLKFVMLSIVLCSSLVARADSFYEYKNGKRYLCSLDEEPTPGCEYINGSVYCPGPGETCSYINGSVYCGFNCSYINGSVYCPEQGETCSYINGSVYCGLNCSYINGSVYCSRGGLGTPARPATPRR